MKERHHANEILMKTGQCINCK